MKKCLFICLFALLLTGCKNEIKCSLENEDDDYKFKQEVVLKADKNDLITYAETTITMTFESEEEAQQYYSIFDELEEKSELKIDKNVLIIKDYEEYSDNSKKQEVKKQLESSGYKCN